MSPSRGNASAGRGHGQSWLAVIPSPGCGGGRRRCRGATRVGAMVCRCAPRPPASICGSSMFRPARATASKSGRTVVSGGMKYAASGTSSKPTTLMSSGTRLPALVQRPQHAEREVVVGREDRGDLGHPGQHLPAPVAGGRGPVRRQHRRHLRPPRPQRRPPAVDAPRAVEPVRRPGHVPDRAVPRVEQVPGGLPGPRHLVDRHQWRRPARITVDGDQRHAVRQVVERLAGRLDRGDDHDAGDPVRRGAARRRRRWTGGRGCARYRR